MQKLKDEQHRNRFALRARQVRSCSRSYALVALVLLLLFGCAPDTESGAGMAEANRLYEAGRYAEAVQAYEALIELGVAEGEVYYNLGNAYLKDGDIGRTILNYRRAQQLLPRDPDVNANLEMAKGMALDQLQAQDGVGLADWVERALIRWTTLDEAAAIALGMWLLCCVLVAAMILRPRARSLLRIVLWVAAILLALSVFSVGYRLVDVHGRDPGVVVAESIEVASGPGDDYLVEFTLHAGTEVRVLERRNGWLRIALPGDLQGWVPQETVETL